MELHWGQTAHILQQIVGFGDQLHVAILNAVVHHLDVMPRATGANVGYTGAIIYLSCNFRDNRLHRFIGRRCASWHQARAIECPIFATANAHAHEAQVDGFQFFDPPFGVGVERVAPVDNHVALIEQGLELTNHSINGAACFYHHQDFARTIQGLHKLFE